MAIIRFVPVIKSPEAENIIIGGDFNFYASSEPAYYTITSGTSVAMYDPINRPGNWHNNSSFADIHTQATRTSLLSDGGNNGGMDDRFDMFFVSGDLMTGTNRMIAIPSSYEVVGQDGQRFNQSVISPANQAVPWNIATKLYYMSDHLPVFMKFALGGTVWVDENIKSESFEILQINNSFYISSEKSEVYFAQIYNSLGQSVLYKKMNGNNNEINIENLPKGMYVLYVYNNSTENMYHKFVKQ
jgi:hypothetical protein